MMLRRRSRGLALFASVAIGCSQSAPQDQSTSAAPAGQQTSGDDAGATADVAVTASADATTPSAWVDAVRATAENDPSCGPALENFYWEVGDAQGVLASGRVGRGFDATTAIDIASASKLVSVPTSSRPTRTPRATSTFAR